MSNYGTASRDSKLRAVLKRARDNAPAEDQRRHGRDLIESYYLQRPQVPLAVTVLFFSFISLIMGLLGELLSNLEYLLTIENKQTYRNIKRILKIPKNNRI